MNDIQRPDIGQALTRFFGIRESNPAPTLSPEVQPCVIVGDLTVPTEPNWIRQASGYASNAAAVGLVSQVQLFNPIKSGVLIKVSSLWVSPFTTGEVGEAISGTALANDLGTVTKNFTNGVLGVNSNPVGQMRWEQTLGISGNTGWRAAVAVQNSPYVVPVSYVLLEGQGLNVAKFTANEQFLAAFLWTEIPVEPTK